MEHVETMKIDCSGCTYVIAPNATMSRRETIVVLTLKSNLFNNCKQFGLIIDYLIITEKV